MHRAKLSKEEMKTVIKSRRWPDGTLIDGIHYVWPDEGIWIATSVYNMEDNRINDIEEQSSLYWGKKPIYPPETDCDSLVPKCSSFLGQYLTNERSDYCYYGTTRRLMFLPEGCVVLERYLDNLGRFTQELIISSSTDNPQPRFNFGSAEILHLPTAVRIAA